MSLSLSECSDARLKSLDGIVQQKKTKLEICREKCSKTPTPDNECTKILDRAQDDYIFWANFQHDQLHKCSMVQKYS